MLTLWIGWAALTAVVLMLAIFRKFSTRHDDLYVHLADAEAPVISEQVTVARKLEKLDYWGKTLTVVDVAYLVVMIGIICFKAWRISLETMN